MKSILLLFLLASALSEGSANVRRYCLVSYQKGYGYSDEYKMEVQFMTGKELNKAANTYNYQSFSNYALIWFDEGEVAILELEGIVVGVGEEFDNEDFRKLFQLMGETTATHVNTQNRTKWRIKGKNLLRWVDPRAE